MATKKKPVAATQKDSKYKILRNVTMPMFKFVIEDPAHLKLTGEYFVGKAREARGKEKAMDPATVAPAVNLDTGELVQVILGAALKSILDETYPGHGYVDRAFRIVKHEKREGQRYYTYSVDEIEAE